MYLQYSSGFSLRQNTATICNELLLTMLNLCILTKVKTTLSVHSTQKTKKSENIPPLHAEGHVPMPTHSCCQEVEEVAAEVLAKWQHKQETVAHACWSVVQQFKSKQLASGTMYSRQQNIFSHRASEVTDHWICQLIFSQVYEKTHRHTKEYEMKLLMFKAVWKKIYWPIIILCNNIKQGHSGWHLLSARL